MSSPSPLDCSCVGLVRNGRMLVVQTNDYPDRFQPVGGHVDAGETDVDAAVREVSEETGWVLAPNELALTLLAPMDVGPGTLSFYLAAAPEGEPTIDAAEIADYRWVDVDEISRLPAFPGARRFFSWWSLLRSAEIGSEDAMVERCDPGEWIGRFVPVTIDRPIGSVHPKHGAVYPINYGYVPGLLGGDGEELDAYVLGANVPLVSCVGECIAVVRRHDDVEDKLVVSVDGQRLTRSAIAEAVAFQECYYDSDILDVY